jgi:hypothetical protein
VQTVLIELLKTGKVKVCGNRVGSRASTFHQLSVKVKEMLVANIGVDWTIRPTASIIFSTD